MSAELKSTISVVDKYESFDNLRAGEVEGVDYRVIARARPGAHTVVIAPHGGKIEEYTSGIARAIAGRRHSFYAFEGTKPRGNRGLHITSHKFNEPRALRIVAAHRRVLAIHGCNGDEPVVYLGGRDEVLVSEMSERLEVHGVRCRTTDHAYPGIHPFNICNRGRTGAGVQMELPVNLRVGEWAERIVAAARALLVDAIWHASP